jgi:hypothetical protein
MRRHRVRERSPTRPLQVGVRLALYLARKPPPADQAGRQVGKGSVTAALVQVVGVSAVGVQTIGGDEHVGQVEIVEQGAERGDLACLVIDLDLPEYDPSGLVEHWHQMWEVDPAVGGADAVTAQGLAVQGEHAALFTPRCSRRRR